MAFLFFHSLPFSSHPISSHPIQSHPIPLSISSRPYPYVPTPFVCTSFRPWLPDRGCLTGAGRLGGAWAGGGGPLSSSLYLTFALLVFPSLCLLPLTSLLLPSFCLCFDVAFAVLSFPSLPFPSHPFRFTSLFFSSPLPPLPCFQLYSIPSCLFQSFLFLRLCSVVE